MEEKLKTLFARLDSNLTEFTKKWEVMTVSDLIAASREITAVKDAHYYLTSSHGYEPDEVDYLLLFENPLQVTADKWQERMEDISDFSFALNEVFDKRDAMRDYDLVKEKPSVLEKLRASTDLAAKTSAPAKEQEVR